MMTAGLLAVMLAQSSLGLLFPDRYRDVPWIKATWFGNDWITLVAAVPLLAIAVVYAQRGSIRALLGWAGLLGYAAYNYSYYLMGAALNEFFPLYVAAVLLSSMTLIVLLSAIDVDAIAAGFERRTPARGIAAYLVFVGIGLSVVWLGMWAAYVFAGRPTPVEPEAFRLVAALDLSIMVPLLVSGGVLLWRQRPWGYLLAAIASIQSALYLLVLSLNSFIAIRRGLVDAPGELPVWGTLMVLTASAAAVLLRSVRPAPR
jgi:hypothetical protein